MSGFLEKVNFEDGARRVSGGNGPLPGGRRCLSRRASGRSTVRSRQRRLNGTSPVLERDRGPAVDLTNTVAQATLDTANAQLKKAGADILRLKGVSRMPSSIFSYTKILAHVRRRCRPDQRPMSAALVTPDSGALVTADASRPIYVGFPSHILYFSYRERVEKGEMSAGANVSITLPNGTDYPEKGTIDFAREHRSRKGRHRYGSRRVSQSGGTLSRRDALRVVLEQVRSAGRAGVPPAGVQRDQQGAFVMVVDANSKVELRRVDVQPLQPRPGRRRQGTEEGENVITGGCWARPPGIVVDAVAATTTVAEP